MFWIDYWYIVFVIPPMLLAMWASFNVNSTYKKYSRVLTSRGMTGYDSARRILDKNGLYNVKIEHISGNLTDHFDPRTNVVRLSDSVYDSTSVAAVGVAAHEAGHAVQYAENYMPMKIRGAILPAASIGSSAGFYLAILGIVFSFNLLTYVGIGLFMAVVAFQLVTLPVEFNASQRAIASLENGVLRDDELAGSRKVLRAAALTYVAALLTAIGNLLRLLALASSRRRD